MVFIQSKRQHRVTPIALEGEYVPAVNQVLAISVFARTIAFDTNLETLPKEGLHRLLDVFEPADAGALFLYQAGPDRLVAECAHGYDTDAISRVSLKSGESIVGKVFQSGQAAHYATSEQAAEAMADAAPENRALFRRLMRSSEHPRSVVCVPLVCGDGTLGAVILENWRKPLEFTESDLELARTLVGLLALAVDRLRLAREVSHSRQVLEEASKLQQDIMAALSHDMRTPLASIKGYASALLLDDVQWEEQTAREYLEIIGEESDKLSEITADLLETSMIDAGQLEIEKEPTLLAHLVQEVVDDLSRRTDVHRFLVSFPPDFPVVDADSGRMRRVLFNLVDNAVKYSPGGGLVVVRGWVSEDEVVVCVADQGQGIAPEHLNRLFERFFRVKFASGQHVVGSGLGLPIAHSIVEAHGGRIWAESELGEGTAMYFTLPRAGLSQGAETAED